MADTIKRTGLCVAGLYGYGVWIRRPCLQDKIWLKPYKLRPTNIDIYQYIIYFVTLKILSYLYVYVCTKNIL